jgi:hypothetical protein
MRVFLFNDKKTQKIKTICTHYRFYVVKNNMVKQKPILLLNNDIYCC